MAGKEPWNGDTRDWDDDEIAKRLAIADVIATLIEEGSIVEIAPGVYTKTEQP